MKRKLKAGTTSVMLPIFVADSSSTSGAGLSLAFNAAGLVGEYRRRGQSAWTTFALSAGTLGTWSSGGWVADAPVSGTDIGAYEVGIPDAALAAGQPWVVVRYRGATNMLTNRSEIELDAVDYQDAVRFGLSGIPNASAGASGGLLINGSNTGTVTLAALTVTGAQTNTGGITANITGNLVGTVSTLTTYTGNTPQTGDAFARIGTAGAGLTAIVLPANGLDSITATTPGAVATTFPAKLMALWAKFSLKSTLTSTQMKTFAADGITVITTQTVSDDGTTQTQGIAS